MATTAPPPAQPAPQAPIHHDEFHGVFGFFRRYQKIILYTAGMFALLTFGVTGAMIGLFESWFRREQPKPTITVAGREVQLTDEDLVYGQLLEMHRFGLPPVLPNLDPGDGRETQLSTVFAILRRVAIQEGIDVSMVEVDRAIEFLREAWGVESATQLALRASSLHGRGSLGSLAHYRDLTREAMRIGTYVRLQALAADATDAALLADLIDGKEKITLKVATFDQKALEDQLKAGDTMTDDDLQKWLSGKTDAEKNLMQVFDANKVQLTFGLVRFAEFDAAEWQEELKELNIGDEQLQRYYEMEKEQRFKQEGDVPYRPLDDQAVKDELTKVIQVEEVLNGLLRKLRDQQNEAQRKPNEELAQVREQLLGVEARLKSIKERVAADPADAAAKEDLRRVQDEELPQITEQKRLCEEAVTAARADFDFAGAFAALTKDKKGFATKALSGLMTADELKDLDQQELGLGSWTQSNYPTYLQNKGDLAQLPGRTKVGAFLYQVTDIQVRPLKPWDKLKTILVDAYWAEQAKQQAETKRKLLTDALLRLAKERIPEQVAEIEGRRQTEVDQQMQQWETKLQADRQAAEAQIARQVPGSKAHAQWTARRDELDAELATKEQKRLGIEASVAKKLEDEIAAAARKKYGDVLDAAAQEAGFTVASIGPYPRELNRTPRFDKRFDPTVVFLFQGRADQLAVGEATDVLEDPAKKRWHVAVCEKVEPMQISDLTRREVEQARGFAGWDQNTGKVFTFAESRLSRAIQQSFSLEALEKRFHYKLPQS